MSYYLVTGGEKWTQVASLSGWKAFREWVEGLDAEADQVRHLVEYGWSQKLSDLSDQLTAVVKSGKPSKDVRGIGQAVLDALADKPDGAESCLLTDGLTSDDDPDDSGWVSAEDEEGTDEPDQDKGIESGDIETPEGEGGIPPMLSRKAIEAAHVKRVTDSEGRASESIAQFFRDYVRQIASRVAKSGVKPDPSKDARKQAEAILKKAFDPQEHLKGLVRAIAPHLAASFCVGAGAELELTRKAAKRKAARGWDGTKYSPDQPRDEAGRFGEGGGSSDSSQTSASDESEGWAKSEGELREQVHQVEDDIRASRDYETAVAIDDEGNEIFSKDGEGTQVSFTADELKAMTGAKLFTHNHPRGWGFEQDDPRSKGNSFSEPDVMLGVKCQIGEMRAVSPGYRHSLKVPKDFADKQYDAFDRIVKKGDDRTYDEDAKYAAFKSRYGEARDGWITKAEFVSRTAVYSELKEADAAVRIAFQGKIDAAMDKGEVAAAIGLAHEAEANHQHEMMLRVAAKFGWEYTREEYKPWQKEPTKSMTGRSNSMGKSQSCTRCQSPTPGPLSSRVRTRMTPKHLQGQHDQSTHGTGGSDSDSPSLEISEVEPGTPMDQLKFAPSGEVVRGTIAGFPVTAREHGIVGKVSKKTTAALESALADKEIVGDMKAAGIKEIRVDTAAMGRKRGAPENWTAASEPGILVVHTKTAEAIAKSTIPERVAGGMPRVIAHEAGHGVYNKGSDATKKEFATALGEHQDVTERIGKIVSVAPNPQAFSNTGSRLVTESFAEISAMRRYAADEYGKLPSEIRTPLETIHSKARDTAESFERVHGSGKASDEPDATKYSDDQPRDESGRFGEGSGSSTATEETGSGESPTWSESRDPIEIEKALVSKVSGSIESVEGLSEQSKKTYLYAAKAVMNYMPKDALGRLERNMKDVKFYDSCETMTDKLIGKFDQESRDAGKTLGGAFEHEYGRADGTVHLDGGTESTLPRDFYAHEFAHAVDGEPHAAQEGENGFTFTGGGRISDTNKWQDAWESEIKDGALSDYATSEPSEGFAEFARIAWKTPRDAFTQFPKCWAVWEAEGLVMPAPDKWKE